MVSRKCFFLKFKRSKRPKKMEIIEKIASNVFTDDPKSVNWGMKSLLGDTYDC